MAYSQKGRLPVWNSRRGTHLGSGHVRPRQQTGHMIAIASTRTLRRTLQAGGRPHMGLGRAHDPDGSKDRALCNARTGGRRLASPRALPAPSCPSPGKAPPRPVVVPAKHDCPKLPGSGLYRSARGHRTRSRLQEYPREGVPYVSEIRLVFVSETRTFVKVTSLYMRRRTTHRHPEAAANGSSPKWPAR